MRRGKSHRLGRIGRWNGTGIDQHQSRTTCSDYSTPLAVFDFDRLRVGGMIVINEKERNSSLCCRALSPDLNEEVFLIGIDVDFKRALKGQNSPDIRP